MSRYARWAKSVALWDGILPVVLSLVGPVLRLVFGDGDDVNSTLIALFIIIGVFLLRCKIGFDRLRAQSAFVWQKVLFLIGVFFLIQLDALIFVFSMHAQDAGAIVVMLIAYLIYLPIMATAFFPFRAGLEPAAEEREYENPYQTHGRN